MQTPMVPLEHLDEALAAIRRRRQQDPIWERAYRYLYRRISHAWYWLRTHTYNRYHILDMRSPEYDYRWGWIDRSSLLLVAPFRLLEDFVEQEWKYTLLSVGPHLSEYHTVNDDPQTDDEREWARQELEALERQVATYQVIFQLYRWWKVERRQEEAYKDRVTSAWVMKRAGGLCVLCGAPAQDAHHILERKLWTSPGEEGGYFLSNGAAVCGPCHMRCETTEFSVEQVRSAAGITKFRVPSHLYADVIYDKWANEVLPNGTRLRGELYDDPSVQKVLGDRRSLFTEFVKYARTWHLPYSPGTTRDDRVHPDTSMFDGRRVVVTLKYDGECTSMYPTGIHARSTSYDPHPSRNRVRALQAKVGPDLPKGWRVCGENVFAKHSIHYQDLPDYFLMFSIWDDANTCWSWIQTQVWAGLLDLCLVPTIYEGVFDAEAITAAFRPYQASHEGYVVRLERGFHYSAFRKSTAKWVRKEHVTTSHHWKFEKLVPNLLKESP